MCLFSCACSWGAEEPSAFAVLIEDAVREAYIPGGLAGVYRQPSAHQVAAMRALVRDCHLQAAQGGIAAQRDEFARRAGAMGFVFERIKADGRVAWMIREAGDGHGGGIYLIADRFAHAVIVQAPHARTDRHSEKLAARIFAAGEFAALHAGTISRYAELPAEGSDHGASDLCHNSANFMHGAMQGAADAFPHALVVQLHGYAARDEGALATAAAVVSDGTMEPGLVAVQCFAELLARWQSYQPVLHGRDVTELGGTTNHQGAWLRLFADDAFIHLEMAPPIRERMLIDHDLLVTTTEALALVAQRYAAQAERPAAGASNAAPADPEDEPVQPDAMQPDANEAPPASDPG